MVSTLLSVRISLCLWWLLRLWQLLFLSICGSATVHDVACHFFGDCHFGILALSCGELMYIYSVFVVGFQLLFVYLRSDTRCIHINICHGQWNKKFHLIHAGS